MSKKELYNQILMDKQAILELKNIMNKIPYYWHFIINKVFNVKVSKYWMIEKDRINEDFLILFMKSGKCTYFAGDKEIPISKGQILIISNKCPHTAQPNLENLHSFISVRFGIKGNIDQKMHGAKNPFYILCEHYYEFEKLFEDLFNIYSSNCNPQMKLLECNAILTYIMANMIKKLESYNNSSQTSKAELIKKYLDEKMNHAVSLEEIAKHLFISKKYLINIFKFSYGITPKQYLIKLLIDHSDFLLANSTMTIGEISEYFGYPNQYAFSKQYKSIKNCSPLQTRKNLKSKSKPR